MFRVDVSDIVLYTESVTEPHAQETRQCLLNIFLGLPFAERSVEKTRHFHNENIDDENSESYGHDAVTEEEIILIAIQDNWMEKLSESFEKEIQKLQVRADMYEAYEQDVTRATGIIDSILQWWETTSPDEIPQQHQVVRILMDGRRKAIENIGEQDPDNTLRVVEEDTLQESQDETASAILEEE